MSNLNLNILVQSVEGLAQQLEKSNANLQQDKTSLAKAKALLEGLKGMYGIDAITMDSSDMINIDIDINGFTTKMKLDPTQNLKLASIKVRHKYKILLFSVHIELMQGIYFLRYLIRVWNLLRLATSCLCVLSCSNLTTYVKPYSLFQTESQTCNE